jgi:hypothetical protein
LFFCVLFLYVWNVFDSVDLVRFFVDVWHDSKLFNFLVVLCFFSFFFLLQ